jgi:hypothetical protein
VRKANKVMGVRFLKLIFNIAAPFLGVCHITQAQNYQPPLIDISGATASPAKTNYFIIKKPTNGSTQTVSISASGGIPLPTTQDNCTNCQGGARTPIMTNSPVYTIFHATGTQRSNTITVNVQSNTDGGEYKFKVTQVSQEYQGCDQGYSGGANPNPKINTTPSKEITLLIYSIAATTRWEAPNNHDHNRRKIGVGEKVDIVVSPATIAISYSGSNCKLADFGQNGVKLYATNRGTATVEVNVCGVPHNFVYQVIAPIREGISGAAQSMSTDLNGNPYSRERAGVHGVANMAIEPMDVSFQGILVSEKKIAAIQGIGYFQKYPLGEHKPNTNNEDFNWGAIDDNNVVDGEDHFGFSTTDKPWENGTGGWNIPVCYTLKGEEKPVDFFTSTQVMTISTNGDCTATKFGVTVTNLMANPTPSPTPIPNN